MNFATLKLSAVCRQLDKSKKYLLCRLAGETLFPEQLFTASLKRWRALLESCKFSLSPACELLFTSEVSWGASSLLQELYQYKGNCCAKTQSTAQEKKKLCYGTREGKFTVCQAPHANRHNCFFFSCWTNELPWGYLHKYGKKVAYWSKRHSKIVVIKELWLPWDMLMNTGHLEHTAHLQAYLQIKGQAIFMAKFNKASSKLHDCCDFLHESWVKWILSDSGTSWSYFGWIFGDLFPVLSACFMRECFSPQEMAK